MILFWIDWYFFISIWIFYFAITPEYHQLQLDLKSYKPYTSFYITFFDLILRTPPNKNKELKVLSLNKNNDNNNNNKEI